MDRDPPPQRLGDIPTIWDPLKKVVSGSSTAGSADLQPFVDRYGGAVRRYLLGAVRDPDAADELFQEFALRVCRGAFRNASPERGRFRDYIKTALINLIIDYNKKKQASPAPLSPEAPDPAVFDPSTPDAEREFMRNWRDELLNRTWDALQAFEQKADQPVYTVLRFRTDHPQVSSEEMAAQLGQRLKKTFTIDAVRKALQRAREKFTDLLLAEVKQSLADTSPEAVRQELTELGLLSYCQSALQRRGG